MGRTAVIVGLVVVGAAGLGVYAWVKSRTPDFGPAGPNAGLAPASLAVYVEIPDLAATWKTTEATDSWKDFVGSKIAKTALESTAMKELAAAVDQIGAKAGYALDEGAAMKFLGRECSVGVALDRSGGRASAIVLTKLDVAALKKDFAARDVSSLWNELQKRTGKCDFVVTSETYRGYPIANATRGATVFHAALLGDTLAVSTDAKLVRAAVDCRRDGGDGSIGKRADFKADMAALPKDATLRAWYDLDALDRGRASLDAGLDSLGVAPQAASALHVVLDGTRGAKSVGQAVTLSEGDLYRVSWKWSKGDELFADKDRPKLPDFYYGDWVFLAQADGLDAVAAAWDKSALKKNLAAGRVGRVIEEFVDDPTKKARDLQDWTGARVGRAPGGDEEDAEKKAAGDDLFDRFGARALRRLFVSRAPELFGGDAAFGVDWTGKRADAPRVAAAFRLGVEGRLDAMAISGSLLKDADAHVVCEEVGGRKVFTGGADKSVHWALVGDALVIGGDRDFVRQAARNGAGKPLGPPAKWKEAVASMKPGWRLFTRLDVARLGASAVAAGKSDRALRDVASMADRLRPGGAGGEVCWAAYVPDDFSSVEFRARSTGVSIDDEAVKKALAAPPRKPLSWEVLPDSTMFQVAVPTAGVEAVWHLFKEGVAAGKGDLREIENEFRQKMGMDLERELLPALGHEIGIAVTFRGAGDAASANETPVPGLLFDVEAKDPAVVERAMDRAVELLEESLRDETVKKPKKILFREKHGGLEVYRLAPQSQAGATFKPACAMVNGYVWAASDVSALAELIDAKEGKGGKRLVDAPVFADATATLGKTSAAFVFLDWTKMVDQIAVYSPQLSELTSRVAPPQYPDNMDENEWKRRLADYKRRVEEEKKTAAETTKAWIDALRVVDWVGVCAKAMDDGVESTTVVKFAK